MTNVDLSTLRIDDAPAVAPKRPIGPKLLVSAVLLLTVTVAATFLWPLVSPPRAVRMAAVQAVSAGSKVAASLATTEAVGWAEADPFGSARQPVLHQEPKTPQPASRLGEQVNTSACKRRFSLGCVFTPIALFSCSPLWMRWTSLRWSSLWRRVPRSTRPIRTWAGACCITRSTSRTNSRACTCVSSLAWPWPRPTLSRCCAVLQDNKAVGDGSLGGRGVCPKADLTAQSALR